MTRRTGISGSVDGAVDGSGSSTAERQPILRAESVTFAYGRVQVLFGVSLQVGAGEAIALLGTNGAGKSTFLRVVCGLERPTGGRVVFAGRDVTGLPAERLVGAGLVLIAGGRGVFADMSVEENLQIQVRAAPPEAREVARQRIPELFELFPRLGERRRQLAGSLSGGEQQQLALAKGVLLRPLLLCIDELSLGLAPAVVAEIIRVVERLQADGVTLVLVEQSLNIAAQLCKRAVFLEKGAVIFEGPTLQLVESDSVARAVFLGASAR
jgi:ABC-type branched-subunit amino acid transport system ATPase component